MVVVAVVVHKECNILFPYPGCGCVRVYVWAWENHILVPNLKFQLNLCLVLKLQFDIYDYYYWGYLADKFWSFG